MTIAVILFFVLVAAIAFSLGKAEGRSRACRDTFDPFFSEGFYSGWVARHHGLPLDDTRVHPDELKKLVPTLSNPDQEISHWMWHGDHLPFEDFRREQVAKLNRELDKAKNDARTKA
jgi:hypothetical protein